MLISLQFFKPSWKTYGEWYKGKKNLLWNTLTINVDIVQHQDCSHCSQNWRKSTISNSAYHTQIHTYNYMEIIQDSFQLPAHVSGTVRSREKTTVEIVLNDYANYLSDSWKQYTEAHKSTWHQGTWKHVQKLCIKYFHY